MFGLPQLRYTVNGFAEPPVDPLNKFSLEGEGGYQPFAYTFVDRGSAFFSLEEKDAYIDTIRKPTEPVYSFTIGANTYYFMKDVLKVASGNRNRVIMYRNGDIDLGDSTSTAVHLSRTNFAWIATNLNNIADIYCPSNYTQNFKQLFIMKNGDLFEVDCLNRTTTLLLQNIDRFLTKNPAHSCNAIVTAYNGDMYSVWVDSPAGSGATSSGSSKINGINSLDLSFSTLGDPKWSAMFCYKNDLKKVYRFSRGTLPSLTGIEATPYITLTDPSEHYLHGMSNEFTTLLLTNKKLYVYHSRCGENDYYSSTVRTYNMTDGIKISTPTSYSFMIETTSGYYFTNMTNYEQYTPIDFGTNGCMYNYSTDPPVIYTFYNSLKTKLEAIRY